MFSIKKADFLFWGFIFLMALLQLSNNSDLTFPVALMFSITLILTLRVHVVYVVKPIIKSYLKSNNTLKFIVFTFLMSVVTSLFLTAQGYLFISHRVLKGTDLVGLFFGMLMVCILISGVSYSIEIFKQNLESEKKHQELRNSVLEMEIAHVRTQLSPHFTFNILNNLQFLIRKDQEEALDLLSKYSKILRYYVYESQNKLIKLDNEIAFLKYYFQLEKDRAGEDLQIACQWNIPENRLVIIPFLLSTFVENAFKHVSNFVDKPNYIHLFVFLKNENQLSFEIENSTDSTVNNPEKEGVGLKYVQKRLDLSYADNYELVQLREGNKYKIKLLLNLNHE